MRKTLGFLLAAAVLYLVFPPSRSIKSQILSGKFKTIANAIPNRYIVVLATNDLSPIADPTPTPATPKSAQVSSVAAISTESSSTSSTEEPTDDPQVVATATALTSTYGGTFNNTWGVALKGFF